jgi:hypothetical protein
MQMSYGNVLSMLWWKDERTPIALDESEERQGGGRFGRTMAVGMSEFGRDRVPSHVGLHPIMNWDFRR